jgi:hypothetical protein
METPYNWTDVGATSAGFDTGKDWPVDPYWIWAEISNYASFQTGDCSYPVIFELAIDAIEDGFDRESKAFAVLNSNPLNMIYSTSPVTETQRKPTHSRFGTCVFSKATLADLLELVKGGVILRYQLCVGRLSLNDAVSIRKSGATNPETGNEVKIAGIIDDGFPIAHGALRPINANSMPIISLWDQSTWGASSTPSIWKKSDITTYGSDISGSQISDVTKLKGVRPEGEIEERQMYRELERPMWGAQGRTHGVGVLHKASAPRSAFDPGYSTVLVQLPSGTVKDTSGGSLARYVLDGTRYIYWKAREFAGSNPLQLVVNISFGSIAGPHDGTTILEKALDELCCGPNLTAESFEVLGILVRPAATTPKIDVVLAAGNTTGKRIHGIRQVTKLNSGTFWLMVPAFNPRESYLELWLPVNVDLSVFIFKVTAPGAAGNTFELKCSVGKTYLLKHANGAVAAGAIFAKRACQSDGTVMQTMFLLAIPPTEARDIKHVAPFGIWTIEVSIDTSTQSPVTVHGWVERNDNVIGVRTVQQAYLVEDANHSARYIFDSSTLSSIANGSKTTIAGAYSIEPEMICKYSGVGPVLSHVVQGNFYYAPADQHPYAGGIPIPGFYSGSTSSMSGTSIAAPQVTRAILDGSILSASKLGMPSVAKSSLTSIIRK